MIGGLKREQYDKRSCSGEWQQPVRSAVNRTTQLDLQNRRAVLRLCRSIIKTLELVLSGGTAQIAAVI